MYCSDSHHFSISKARIIIDALQSVSFITESKTLQLQNKLANLSGSYNAEILQRTTMRFKAVKHQNEDVYKNIEVIENALKNRRQISFHYYHIDENKNKVYSHDKKLYIEEPIGAVLDDGNYYLLCYRTQKEYTNNMKIFRIDRIDGISVIEREIRRNNEICRATVEVQISPTFWGWMMQFPTKMKIYSPENLKRQYIELVKSAL